MDAIEKHIIEEVDDLHQDTVRAFNIIHKVN